MIHYDITFWWTVIEVFIRIGRTANTVNNIIQGLNFKYAVVIYDK